MIRSEGCKISDTCDERHSRSACASTIEAVMQPLRYCLRARTPADVMAFVSAGRQLWRTQRAHDIGSLVNATATATAERLVRTDIKVRQVVGTDAAGNAPAMRLGSRLTE